MGEKLAEIAKNPQAFGKEMTEELKKKAIKIIKNKIELICP
jgi:hypothetical protein